MLASILTVWGALAAPLLATTTAAPCGPSLPAREGLDLGAGAARPAALAEGRWHAWLESGPREIPFGLSYDPARPVPFAIHNGVETLPVARSQERDGTWTLHLDPYDSYLIARASEDGRSLDGEWVRYRSPTSETRMPFHARAGARARFEFDEAGRSSTEAIAGRWSVTFQHTNAQGKVAESPAVAILEALDRRRIQGTFLTPLGDYRYLAGSAWDGRLQLSCFDGAHAFLFEADLTDDERLEGNFWSRDVWHETWIGVRDDDATMPDDFSMTSWNEGSDLASLCFPDLDAQQRCLNDRAFAGPARLIVLFGSWCPNCGDATDYLRELRQRYGERGLQVLGLAFEFGDDFERQQRVLRRYAQTKRIDYPILIAGTSDKAQASKAFPALDRVRAYPTTIFLDGEGQVRAVHTGFSGPATGAAHERLRERFEGLIESMLP